MIKKEKKIDFSPFFSSQKTPRHIKDEIQRTGSWVIKGNTFKHVSSHCCKTGVMRAVLNFDRQSAPEDPDVSALQAHGRVTVSPRRSPLIHLSDVGLPALLSSPPPPPTHPPTTPKPTHRKWFLSFPPFTFLDIFFFSFPRGTTNCVQIFTHSNLVFWAIWNSNNYKQTRIIPPSPLMDLSRGDKKIKHFSFLPRVIFERRLIF